MLPLPPRKEPYYCTLWYLHTLCTFISRLTIVSCMDMQSRTCDTTPCVTYTPERSILIEHSPKAYCKNYLLNVVVILLTIIRYIRLILSVNQC